MTWSSPWCYLPYLPLDIMDIMDMRVNII
jgi:hypothetical protein